MQPYTSRYSVLQCFYWFNACIVYGYARVFLNNAGFSASASGVVLAFCCLFAALLQPLLGAVMAKRPALTLSKVILAIAGVSALSAAALLFKPAMPVIAAGFLVLGTTAIAAQSFVDQACFDLERTGKKISYPVARGAGSVAYALYSKLLAALGNEGKLMCHLTVTVGLAACAFIMLRGVPSVPAKKQEDRTESGFFKRNKRFLFLACGQALVFFNHRVMLGYLYDLTVYAGGTDKTLGNLLLMGAFLECPAMLLVSRLVKKRTPARLIRFGALMYPLRPLVLLISPKVWAVFAHMLLQMFTFAFVVSAMPIYADSVASPGDRVRLQTFNTGSVAVGGFFGYLLGGMLIDNAGMKATLITCLVTGVIGAVVMCAFTDTKTKS